MEVAPDLQFKHYTLADAHLSADVLVKVQGVSLSDVAVCCDVERHVYHAGHTDPRVAEALAESHWYELREWARSGPGAAAVG